MQRLVLMALAFALTASVAVAQEPPMHDLRDVQRVANNVVQEMDPALKDFRYEATLLTVLHKVEKELAQNPPAEGIGKAIAAIDDFNHRTERADQPPTRSLRQIADGARKVLDDARAGSVPTDIAPLRDRMHHEWTMPLQQLLSQHLAALESIQVSYQFAEKALQSSVIEGILAVEEAARDPKKP